MLSDVLIPSGWKTRKSDKSEEKFIKNMKTSMILMREDGRTAVDHPDWNTQWPHIQNNRINRLLLIMNIQKWKRNISWQSYKLRNKMVHTMNGNLVRISKLKVLHWNGGSKLWANKRWEIEHLLWEKKPDLCFISEANLWNEVPEDERIIQGHQIILPNTMGKLGYARIILLVKNGLNVHVIKDQMDTETATFWIRIGESKTNGMIIGGIYREHVQLGGEMRATTWQERQRLQEVRWRTIVERWCNISRNMKCFMVGNLNLDHKKWDSPDQYQEKLVDLVKDKVEVTGFQQIINGITHTRRGAEDSLLDHIWTNCNQRTLRHYNETRDPSDHNIIGVDISLKDIKPGGQNIVHRLWKKFDKERCHMKLKHEDWSQILEEENIDIANSLFEEKFCRILDSEAPMGIVQVRAKYNKWISQTTKDEMKVRDMVRIRARLTDDQDDWTEYRARRNDCTGRLRNDKSKYMREMFDRIEIERDSGKLFSTTKQLLGLMGAGPPDCLQVNGNTTRKQTEIVNILANFYHEKIVKIKNKIPRVNTDPLATLRRAYNRWNPVGGKLSFVLQETNISQVTKIINSIKNSHTFGVDKVDATVVKLAVSTLAPVIVHIVNLSLRKSKFPAKWKIARVLPLLKSKDLDKTKPSSYRSILQLPLVSKIAERIVQYQILDYLEDTHQISRNHHTYRRKHSTTTALVQLMDTIAVATDMNQITATISMDLSAAFDCVKYDTLKNKLLFYGLDDRTLQWIDSYIDRRSSQEAIGSATSIFQPMNCGVPQGSVMGPLLYLMYVNEMPLVIEEESCEDPAHRNTEVLFPSSCNSCGELPIYVDNGIFIISSSRRNRNQDKVENCFWRVKSYLNANGLQLNEAKTNLTEFMMHQKC